MQTRETISVRLSDLRRKRGSAYLDGQRFDSAALDAAEADLAAIDDAEAERVRREREAADKERAARLIKLRAEDADLTAAAAKALAEAETAMREAVRALKLYIGHEAARRLVRSQINTAGGEKLPIQAEPDLIDKLSAKVAAQILTITGQRSQFGVLAYRTSTLPNPSKSWS